MSDIRDLSIAELGRAYRDRSLSPVEATRDALATISAHNESLCAFNTVVPEIALERAAKAEQELMSGLDLGPLHGIPFGAKDIYDTAGILTSCQSKLRPDIVPDSNAHSVQKILDGGAVLLGKCATIEFATGGPSQETLFPPARNPWNTDHVPGGSSSGSGAAVASGMTRMALGSDTGGSIRGPAAYCGTVGMKPTYGRVSRRGVFPLSFTMDHCGPLSWSVEDAAIALNAMAGFDPLDPASANVPVSDYTAKLSAGVKGMKIGYVANWLDEDENTNPEIRAAITEAKNALRAEGAIVEPVTLPAHDIYHACGRMIILAECYAIHEKDLMERPELYGRPTRERLMAGAFVRGSDYVEALRMRREMTHWFNAEILGKYDMVIAPSTSLPAGRFDAEPNNPLALGGYLTVPFNVTGSPAMSVCCGYTSEGLPISMQIVGRPFDESGVFQVGAAYERATDWRSQRPLLAGGDALAAE